MLRAPEPSDIDNLFNWENDRETWQLSNTLTPYSRYIIEQYVLNAQLDIYSARQLRFIIDLISNGDQPKSIGTIDLFDFDPMNSRAGLGILIVHEERGKGYASEALGLLIEYAFNTLQLHQIYCHITASNIASLNLFTKHGFEIIGLKKEWLHINNTWMDVYFLQLINKFNHSI
jgi:diamine N-acetyltransferase